MSKQLKHKRLSYVSYGGIILLGFALLNGCGNDSTGSGSSTPTQTVDPGNGNSTKVTLNNEGRVNLANNQVAIYYKREDGIYTDWGLHLWNGPSGSGGSCDSIAATQPSGASQTAKAIDDWSDPILSLGISNEYGAYYVVNYSGSPECLNFIIHKGDDKAVGSADLKFDLAQAKEVFTFHGIAQLYYQPLTSPPVGINGAYAHWLDAGTLVWEVDAAEVKLHYSLTSDISVDNGIFSGSSSEVVLTATDLAEGLQQKFPHLASRPAWGMTMSDAELHAMLKSQLIAIARDAQGGIVAATKVQIPGVLDATRYYSGYLGAITDGSQTEFKLWSPTAQQVRLWLYETATASTALSGYPVDMMESSSGVWSYNVNEDLHGKYYLYELTIYHPLTGQVENYTVTDPYSLGLSQNSLRSLVVDLERADTKPTGWDAHMAPAQTTPEDTIVYEGHVRDFSVIDDLVDPEHQGKFLAFASTDSYGIQHLIDLQSNGLTHFHLLPAFDIATVDEDPAMQINWEDSLAELCAINNAVSGCDLADTSLSIKQHLENLTANGGNTVEVQSVMNVLRNTDAFNWGYDPLHYTVPRGKLC